MEVKSGLGRTKLVGKFQLGTEISKWCQEMYWTKKIRNKGIQ
jgi:hypothetical protein